MTSSKPIKNRAATAGRIDALTQAWKKAFDTRIRTAALTRRMPHGSPPGKAAGAAAKDRPEINRRAQTATPCAGPRKRPCTEC